jgi:hypothetical protein
MNKGYETGMKITFEPRSQTAIVSFRGRLTVLPGRFATEDAAVAAGETFCRQHGWRPVRQRPAQRVMLRSAW